jgi:hypothetical protein
MALFKKHIRQVEDWMDSQKNLQYINVDFNAILKDPTSQVKMINQFLGGELNEIAMSEVIDPQLYRQRKE